MRTLLALDLGTTTGWALRRAGLITSGSQSFKPSRFEGAGMRFLKFQRWLDEMLKEAGGIDEIQFEEVRNHAGTTAAHVYGGFLSYLQGWCEINHVPFGALTVQQIKEHATGNKKASKEDMKKWARGRLMELKLDPHALTDDNQADALAILKWMTDHETSSDTDKRPALHSQSQGRVQVGPLALARRPVTNRRR